MKQKSETRTVTFYCKVDELKLETLKRLLKRLKMTSVSFMNESVDRFIAKHDKTSKGLTEALSVCYLCKEHSEFDENSYLNTNETEFLDGNVKSMCYISVCPECKKKLSSRLLQTDNSMLSELDKQFKNQLLDKDYYLELGWNNFYNEEGTYIVIEPGKVKEDNLDP